MECTNYTNTVFRVSREMDKIWVSWEREKIWGTSLFWGLIFNKTGAYYPKCNSPLGMGKQQKEQEREKKKTAKSFIVVLYS